MDLTRSDDDPVRFAQRLLQGLATVDPEAAELGTLVSLHGGGLGTPLLEAVDGLMAELPETVLVLDDLHQLTNAKLLADLGRLVELRPPTSTSSCRPGWIPPSPGAATACAGG